MVTSISMAASSPAILQGTWLPLRVPLYLHHGCVLILLTMVLAVPTCRCRSMKELKGGNTSSSGTGLPAAWKITLAVLLPALVLLALGVAAACCLHRRHALGNRRWGGGAKPNPRSVNGGMIRSDPTVAPAPPDADKPTADVPGQLGCAKRGQQVATLGQPGGAKVMRAFDYDVLADAADGFSGSRSSMLELGRSSSGTMVRGTLVSDEGLETPVAIKVFHHRFNEATSQCASEDLKGLPLRHRNLLCPLGYCMWRRKLYVVYEYMANGSLDEQLFKTKRCSDEVLSWSRRCRIINGVAAGLHHLHSHGSVHGAIKASNVLLDQDMGARLGDFGYSRAVSSMIRFKDCPYLAPECWNEAGVSVGPTFEMDVFYLGAVILEVVCGRRIYNTMAPGSGFWFLADWVGKLYGEGQLLRAVDAALSGGFNKAEAEKLLLLGMECSTRDPKQRPTTEDIVKILSGATYLG